MNYKRVLFYQGDRNYPEAPFSYNQNVSDSIASVESVNKYTTKNLSESISNSEVIAASKVTAVNFNELISLTENFVKKVTKSILETISNSEILVKIHTIFITLSDSISNSETIANVKSKNVSFLETITLSEVIQRFLNGNPITGWNKISKPVNTIWKKIVKPF